MIEPEIRDVTADLSGDTNAREDLQRRLSRLGYFASLHSTHSLTVAGVSARQPFPK